MCVYFYIYSNAEIEKIVPVRPAHLQESRKGSEVSKLVRIKF